MRPVLGGRIRSGFMYRFNTGGRRLPAPAEEEANGFGAIVDVVVFVGNKMLFERGAGVGVASVKCMPDNMVDRGWAAIAKAGYAGWGGRDRGDIGWC